MVFGFFPVRDNISVNLKKIQVSELKHPFSFVITMIKPGTHLGVQPMSPSLSPPSTAHLKEQSFIMFFKQIFCNFYLNLLSGVGKVESWWSF
jgi:hypothetical protein